MIVVEVCMYLYTIFKAAGPHFLTNTSIANLRRMSEIVSYSQCCTLLEYHNVH